MIALLSSATSPLTRMISCSATGSRKRREIQQNPTAPPPPPPPPPSPAKNSNSGKSGFGFGGTATAAAAAAAKKKKKDKKAAAEIEKWRCVGGCGACCKLDKGPTFPTPEEIFQDSDPSHLQLYKSLIGPDGWCIHYERSTRTCSIYADRPFFCRVEPEVLDKLYGIPQRRFNKEACSACKDTITAVYGSGSEELKNFNRAVRVAVTQN